jgi:type II secretory ATPase GspE/PulE/Tfp pilus assembly ATPase PilB-like protein
MQGSATALLETSPLDPGIALDAATAAAAAFDPAGGRPSAPGADGTIVRLADLLVAAAVERRASDVHLEPLARGAAVRFRVDGLLEDGPAPAASAHRALVTRIKVLSGLDVVSSRAPQDGAFRANAGGRPVDVRVSILPTIHGESVVLRILDRGRAALGLDALGLLPDEEARLLGILDAPHGLVAVAGPTGSGKTTTLHALLGRLRRPGVHVVSIEDPVEVEAPGVRQVQVDEAAGVTFAAGLRSILRHDPDVILVGETRDPETAALAARAALTGHLVLTTVHAPDAPSVALRLRDLGVPARLLASVLRGVVAQRLVRRPCAACAGRGCDACRGRGTSGRTGVFEVMPVSLPLRRLLAADAPPEVLDARAREEGLRPLAEAGLERARRGIVSLAEGSPGTCRGLPGTCRGLPGNCRAALGQPDPGTLGQPDPGTLGQPDPGADAP